MTTPTTTKPKTKKRKDPEPAASATPDRGEESSLEKQAKPAFSPSQQHGGGSPGMGPGPATSVVGSNEGVVEAEIPDGPSASDD
jgi:hypothetical protein